MFQLPKPTVTQEETAEAELVIEKEKPLPVIEAAADEITVKKIVQVEEEEEQPQQKLALKKKKQPQAAAAEFKLREEPKQDDKPQSAEESFQVKVKPKDKPTAPVESAFEIGEASLEITERTVERRPEQRFEEESDEMKVVIQRATTEEKSEEIVEEFYFIATTTYISESPDGMTIVEGERVRVIKKTSQDHWLVKKVITKESGLVPPDILKEAEQYTHYLKEVLGDKIQRLPVYGSECFCLFELLPSYTAVRLRKKPRI